MSQLEISPLYTCQSNGNLNLALSFGALIYLNIVLALSLVGNGAPIAVAYFTFLFGSIISIGAFVIPLTTLLDRLMLGGE